MARRGGLVWCLVLSLLLCATLGRANQATAPLQFEQAAYSASEASNGLRVRVVRSAGSQGPITAVLTTEELTAVEDFDFIGVRDHTVALSADQNEAVVTLQLLDNTWQDGQRDLRLVLRDIDDVWQASVDVVITDDEEHADDINTHAANNIEGLRGRRVVYDRAVTVQPTLVPSPSPTNNGNQGPSGFSINPTSDYIVYTNMPGQVINIPSTGFSVDEPTTCRFIFDDSTTADAGGITLGTSSAPVVQCSVPMELVAQHAAVYVSTDNGKSFVAGTANVQYTLSPAGTIIAELAASAAQINVYLFSNWSSSGLEVPCQQIFDVSTVSLLGIYPICTFTASSLLNVAMSYDATIVLGQSLTLKSPSGATSRRRSLTIPLLAPMTTPMPVPVITIPQSIAVCSNLVLDARNSYNHGGRPMNLDWQIEPAVPSAAVGAQTVLFTLPANSLTAGTVYNITLNVVNWLGRAASTSAMVTALPSPVPSVIIVSSPSYITVNERLVLQALTDFASCDPLQNAPIQLQWSISGLTLPSSVSTTMQTLVVPPFTFTVGSQYTVTVQATSASGSTSYSTVISVGAQPVSLSVVGGSSRSVGTSDTATVMAQLSDPNHLGETVVVSFSCVTGSDNLPCGFSLSQPITINLAANGAPSFVNQAIQGSLLPATGATIVVTAVASQTTIKANVTLVPSNGTLSGVTMNLISASPFQPLRAAAITTGASSYTFKWSTVGGEIAMAGLPSYPLSTLDLSSLNLATTGADGASLYVMGPAILPNQKYLLRVDAYDASTNAWAGFATVLVELGSAPSAGSLAVSALDAAEAAGSSIFDVRALGWTADPSVTPLQYSVQVTYDGADRTMSMPSSWNQGQYTTLPMAVDIQSIELTLTVTQRDGTSTNITTTINLNACTPGSADDLNALFSRFINAVNALTLRQDYNQLRNLLVTTSSCLQGATSSNQLGTFAANLSAIAATVLPSQLPLNDPAQTLASLCAMDSALSSAPAITALVQSNTLIYHAAQTVVALAANLSSSFSLNLDTWDPVVVACASRAQASLAALLSSNSSSALLQSLQQPFHDISSLYFNVSACSDPPLTASTSSSFAWSMARTSASASGGATLNNAVSSAQFSSSLLQSTSASCLCLSSMTLPASVYSFAQKLGSTTVSIASDVNAIQLATCSQSFSSTPSQTSAVTNLQQAPAQLSFSVKSTTGDTSTCAFFDPTTNAWSTSGVTTGTASNGAVSCTTSHLTDFAILQTKAPVPTSTQPGPVASAAGFPGWAIAVIVVGTVLLVALIIAAVLLARRLRRRRRDRPAQQPEMAAAPAAADYQAVASGTTAAASSDLERADAPDVLPLEAVEIIPEEIPHSGSGNLAQLYNTARPPPYRYPPTYDTHTQHNGNVPPTPTTRTQQRPMPVAAVAAPLSAVSDDSDVLTTASESSETD